MAYSEASKRATVKYMKKLKRVPLDMQWEQYNRLKAYCDSLGKPVNTTIKEVLFEKIKEAGF